MRIVLLAVGRLKAGPERELCTRYMERAAAGARAIGLTSVEIREMSESRARRPLDRKAEEAAALTALVPAGGRIVALDETGRSLTSAAFADDVGRARDRGAPVYALVIGGADGLDETFRQQAGLVVSFGAMTWPHQIVRALAAEQIYRATTILAGHPYHRA